MKQAFKDCMQYLYPEGVNSEHQLRDMIKIFSMGYFESARLADSAPLLNECLEQINMVRDLNWWPDDSWKWW